MQISLQNRHHGLTIEGNVFWPGFSLRANAPDRHRSHLFVFLHGCGATAQSMIPIAFKFQARFPSAALVVPSGFDPDARGGAAQDWYPTRGLNCDNHRERVASVLPDVEDLVRREQTNFGVPREPHGADRLLAGRHRGAGGGEGAGHRRRGRGVLRRASRRRRRAAPHRLAHPPGARRVRFGRVARLRGTRSARALGAARTRTLDIVEDLGHALSHRAISLGSLRLLQGIYEGRRATLH